MAKYDIEHKKFEPLRELYFYHEIHERLAKGWPASKVALLIHEERGALDTIKRGPLVSLLREYQKAIPPAEKVEHVAPSTHLEAVAQVQQGIDVLEELQKIYELQMKRIDIAYQGEQEALELNSNTHKEIKEARATLETYHNVQADLGLVQRNLGQLEVNSRVHQVNMIVNQHGEDAGAVVSQKRGVSRVLKTFDKLLALAEKQRESEPVTVDVTPEVEPAGASES
jgi:tetratricopeptide (TPR) repeat protein